MQHSQQLQLLIDGHTLVGTIGNPDPRSPPVIRPINVQMFGCNHQLMTSWLALPRSQYDASQIGERDVQYQTWGAELFSPVV